MNTYTPPVPDDGDPNYWCAKHGQEREHCPCITPANVQEWRNGGQTIVYPTLLRRDDDAHLIYRGKVNKLVGDSESGKTFIALAACALELRKPTGRVLYIDADNNGVGGIVPRLDILGAPIETTNDPDRFKYFQLDTADEYAQVLDVAREWEPTVTIIDAHLTVATMHNLDDNSANDMRALAHLHYEPHARTGSAVIVIDHMAKNETSRAHGESGSAQKNATTSGIAYEVTVDDSWSVTAGGSSDLRIIKDRPGGVRARCEQVKGRREKPYVGKFRLHPPEPESVVQAWAIYAPGRDGLSREISDLVARIDRLPDEDRTVRGVKAALSVRTDTASEALKAWKALPNTRGTSPGTPALIPA